jgi:nucleotide-binding universal stress UspA family protein
MIRTIVVPLDGSDFAEQGLVSARRLALDTGAALALIRATFFSAAGKVVGETERQALQEAKDYLFGMQLKLAHEGFAVRTAVLPGDAVSAVLFAAQAYDADLISMSTHGRAWSPHALCGPVAAAVLAKSSIPILLTRSVERPSLRDSRPYRKILVPLDGSASAEAALAYLTWAQLGYGTRVILYRTVEPMTQFDKQATQEGEQRRLSAEDYLTRAGHAFLTGIAWSARVTHGCPTAEITEVAKAEGADLIVLSPHSRDRLQRGHTVAEVLHNAETPVLIVPGSDVTMSSPIAEWRDQDAVAVQPPADLPVAGRRA